MIAGFKLDRTTSVIGLVLVVIAQRELIVTNTVQTPSVYTRIIGIINHKSRPNHNAPNAQLEPTIIKSVGPSPALPAQLERTTHRPEDRWPALAAQLELTALPANPPARPAQLERTTL